MHTLVCSARGALAFLLTFLICIPVVRANEATTGAIVGAARTSTGVPIANAHVIALSPSGRYTGSTDASGRFTMLGIVPDTYAVSVDAAGFVGDTRRGVVLLPGQTQTIAFTLSVQLTTIARVGSTAQSFAVGATSDTFTVTGDTARATQPIQGASGLGIYEQSTVQGSITTVPGVDQDAFGNAILRGGKIQDAVFDFDSVPIPQGLVAEPGGAIVGSQLFTTGVGATTTTLGGFEAEGQNALGGVIDQVPAVGTYPGKTTLDVYDGLAGVLDQGFSFQTLDATPDLRWRYALSVDAQSQYLPYGDGTTFYPAVGGYGLALQSRGMFSTAADVHYQLKPSDDLAFVALFGEAAYGIYDTPFDGLTNGKFNGSVTQFPGVSNQNAAPNSPSYTRGDYTVFKTQWVHTSKHATARLQVYQSKFGSKSAGSWWDDDSYPDGSISYWAHQGGTLSGGSYDVDDYANAANHIKYGVQYTTNNSYLYQVVPTADEYISSYPTIFTELLYLGDTLSLGSRLDVTGTLRTQFNHIVASTGPAYNDNFIDPHLSAAYRFGNTYAFRATYDHTSVAPLPLEADRADTANPAPFVPLAPETANNFTYSFEGGGRTQFRLTYFAERENNRIDVLPVNFRSAVSAGQNPLGVGVPTNAGELRARGAELWIKNGGLELDTNYIKAYSSSAAQFAFNDLNAAAIAAGHLFPLGYVPDFTAILSYEIPLAHHRFQVTPSLSYQSGYPYGNGSMVWTFNSRGQPVQVPNDNNINPGYNYYFLANPACPLNQMLKAWRPGGPVCVPGSNPYIANLGGEGADPNSLHSTPQLFTNLHFEADLSPTLIATLDVANVLGVATPQQLIGNQYLIGPPGYTGGSAAYSRWYAYQECPPNAKGNPQCPPGIAYPYGNGVPTNYFPNTPAGQNPIRVALPWTYGTQGYMPLGYPMGRTFLLRLRYRL